MTHLDQLLERARTFDETTCKTLFLKCCDESDSDLKLAWFENGMIEQEKRLLPLIELQAAVIRKMREALEFWANETEWFNVPIEFQVKRARELGAEVDAMCAEEIKEMR